MARSDSAGLSPAEGRRFAFTVGGAFIVLAALAWWRDYPGALAVAGAVGGTLVLAGVLVPRRLGRPRQAWMRLGEVLARVLNPVIMSVVFYLVITPFGVLRRLLGGNPLERTGEDGTYWVSREDGARHDMERQF